VFTVPCDSRHIQSRSTTTAVKLGDPLGHFIGMKTVGDSYPMTTQGSVQQCDVMSKQHVAKGTPTLASGRDLTTIKLHNKATQ